MLAGGGTGHGLERQLEPLNRLSADCLVATCFLHAHSLALSSPVQKSMLLGGNKKRTLLQLLHTMHALQEEHDINELKHLWKEMMRKPFPGKIKQPVLTRWECVGEAVAHFLNHLSDHMSFAESSKNPCKVGNVRCDIASDFLSLVREKVY